MTSQTRVLSLPMASTPRIYQSLDPALKHIRVLELLPGVFESDLRGIIRTVALDDKSSYEALSYTWGTRTEGRTLKIRPDAKWIYRSIELPITYNLHRALRRLRRLFKSRVLWVDAVCINQEDIDERSAQVALMEDIYSNAASTAIWLGEIGGTNTHHEDLTAGRKLMQFASSILPHALMDLLWNSDCLPMDYAIQTTTPSWKDRGWIIQEYVLSRQSYFQFGSKTRMINKADPSLGHRGFAVPDSGFILEKKIVMFPGLWGLAERLKQLDQIKVEIERGKVISLYHAALATGSSETTDPRDKVYSLLSFLNPIERKLVYPDYYSSIELVFSKATYAAFKGPTNFAILELIKFNTSGIPSALPTWAYDFRTLDPYSRHIQFQELAEMAVPSLQMSAEGTELKLEGVCADIVVGATPALPGFREKCSEHSGHDINTEACVVAEISRKVVELVELTERSIRGDVATNIPNRSAGSDKTDAGDERREFISNQIFATGTERFAQETVVSNLFENWESITTYLGIPRANHIPQSSAYYASRPTLSQTCYYCEEASGSATLFTTMSGNIGVAPSTIKGGDRLVLPLCETASGEIDAKVTPFEKPLALILRQREDDKCTFHGLAHLDGLGDKAQYIQNPKLYTIR
ncbi:HET-domain-containing protein [Xylariaceae sp. AK1471]|nr:HET-domain-containing protein [Xylariaceae sp. AK1471]